MGDKRLQTDGQTEKNDLGEVKELYIQNLQM